jgi:hypothetical protein
MEGTIGNRGNGDAFDGFRNLTGANAGVLESVFRHPVDPLAWLFHDKAGIG